MMVKCFSVKMQWVLHCCFIWVSWTSTLLAPSCGDSLANGWSYRILKSYIPCLQLKPHLLKKKEKKGRCLRVSSLRWMCTSEQQTKEGETLWELWEQKQFSPWDKQKATLWPPHHSPPFLLVLSQQRKLGIQPTVEFTCCQYEEKSRSNEHWQ